MHLAAGVLVLFPVPGDDYGPAPDLDHLNPDLRAALKDWLKWLQDDIGFGGWRLDFVKGYGAKYVEEYIAATVGGEVRACAAVCLGICGH
jgi:alpha-amylase